MLKKSILLFLILPLLLVIGCSDKQDHKIKDHVWKEKTDAINKAKAVEQLIQNNDLKQQQEINKLSR